MTPTQQYNFLYKTIPKNINKKICVFGHNVNGLASKHAYLNKIIPFYDIIVGIETWIDRIEKYEDCLYNTSDHNKTIKLATRKHSCGRASGGTILLTRKGHDTRVDRINERISLIRLQDVVIIVVYMIYENGSKENILEYDYDLVRIGILLENAVSNNKRVIIAGDFNTDTTTRPTKPNHIRTNRLFTKFLEKYKLTLADALCVQRTYFTYEMANSSEASKSRLDHVLLNNNFKGEIQVNIIPKFDTINTSDHWPLEIHFETADEKKEGVFKTQRAINWTSLEFGKNFN